MYLSSGTHNPGLCGSGTEEELQAEGCQPDITRVIDEQETGADNRTVRVTAMDRASFQDTDIFIIREATGAIVMMRQGLKDSESAAMYMGEASDGTPDYEYILGGSGEIVSSNQRLLTRYRMLMRGGDDVSYSGSPGTAIPTALQDYGYTGRVAYSSGEHTLADASQAGVARFKIEPGTHAQVIRLPGNDTAGNQHFYLQAFGVPYGEFQDFALGQQSRGLSESDLQGVEENAWRPKFFVPVKVPVYDEANSLIQEQAYMTYKNQQMAEGVDPDTIEKPEGMYQWLSRPEYQFSVYDLEVSDIRVNEYLEDGSIDTVNILDNDDPTIASSETYLEILYELYGINNDRLDSYQSEDQILILNVAGQETEIHITDNGSLELNDLSFLDKLGSTDYLVISFYLNNDTGNILWEYAFGRNGLHVYGPFEFAPYLDEDLMIARPDTATPEGIRRGLAVYTLGGVRLRYGYQPPAEIRVEDVQSVKLQIEHPGWYCTQPGVNTEEHCTYSDGEAPFEITQPYYPPFPYHINGIPKWSVWWQPATENGGGSGDTLWSNELDINAHYTATFTQLSHMAPVTEYFKIKSRTIKPNSESDEINKGSNIQLVEAILWQLGVSPQYGYSGKSGSRIYSDRGGNNGMTKGCGDQQVENRYSYYAGWPERLVWNKTEKKYDIVWSISGPSPCLNAEVSTEGMIRRFQGRSMGGSKETHKTGDDGILGPGTLKWLRDDYEYYYTALKKYSNQPVITSSHANFDVWLEGVVNIWDSGLGEHVKSTYTEALHHRVLTQAGISDEKERSSKSRKSLLASWKKQESSYHWGRGSPVTPYRMYEGGADEYGSLSFSQLLYKYRYSDRPCTVYKSTALNLYDPEDNIKAFGVHTSMKGTATVPGESNCGEGGFRRAFVDSASRPFRKNFENELSGLVGYKNGKGGVARLTGEDEYGLLARAIGFYNGVGGRFANYSWPYILKTYTRPEVGTSNKSPNCFSCQYTIQVRNQKFGLPYRTYIWKGNANGQPDWCFEYGEREWVARTSFRDKRDAA